MRYPEDNAGCDRKQGIRNKAWPYNNYVYIYYTRAYLRMRSIVIDRVL